MAKSGPNLSRTAAHFLLWLVGGTALWIVLLAPVYDRVVAGVGIALLRAVESPRMTGGIRFAGDHAFVFRTQQFSHVSEQNLELRTHHNNVPFLAALILATPGLALRRRLRALLLAGATLGMVHVLHFMLEVHFHYALENAGPYRVTDLRYMGLGLWASRDNPAQVAKMLLFRTRDFAASVVRPAAPVFLWMLLCWDAIVPGKAAETGEQRSRVASRFVLPLRCALQFALWLAAALILWDRVVEPVYSRAVAGVGVALLHAVESPPMTGGIRFVGEWTVVLHMDPFAGVRGQSLYLRSHHSNAPLLAALILATPGLTRRRRLRTLLLAGIALGAVHVLYFMQEVHFHYAIENVGPYQVTDLRYQGRGLWASLDNPAQVAKLVLFRTRELASTMGRYLVPIVIWLLLCWRRAEGSSPARAP